VFAHAIDFVNINNVEQRLPTIAAAVLHYRLQDLGAIDLRHYLVVRATEYDGGIHKFAFKLFKYGAHVDQHYFHCRTEHELMR